MASSRFRRYLAEQRATAYDHRAAAVEELIAPVRRADLPPDPHDRIADLLRTVRAMWSLLEELGVSREQVHARIAEHDAAAASTVLRQCAQCGSAVGAGRAACQFCGASQGA